MRHALLLAFVLASSAAALAQAYAVDAGGSSLLQAQGITLSSYRENSTSSASFGFAHGFRYGASRETTLDGRTLRLGDSMMALPLPTDDGDAPPSFSTRGITLKQETSTAGFTAFAGASGNTSLTRYLYTTTPTQPLAFLQIHHTPLSNFDTSALIIAGHGFSSLAAARFAPDPSTVAAITAGLIAGKPVLRCALFTRRPTWSVHIQQTTGAWRLGSAYAPDGTVTPEHTGLNLHAEKHFGDRLLLDGASERFAATPGVTSGVAAMQNAGASVRMVDFTAALRGFHSSDAVSATRGEAASVAWQRGAWQARALYAASRNTLSGKAANTDLHVETRLLPQIRVSEDITLGNHSTNLATGGGFDSRWGSVSLSQNTYYFPFGNRSGFRRAAVLSVSLHPFGNFHAEGDTAFGAGVHGYSLTGGTVVEGAQSSAYPQSVAHFHLQPFVVRGTVLDDAGAPVRGAAVRVGADTVFTGSDGAFEVRSGSMKPVELTLSPDEFLTVGRFVAATETRTILPAREPAPVELHVRAVTGGPALLAREQQSDSAQTPADDLVAAQRLKQAISAWFPLLRAAAHP